MKMNWTLTWLSGCSEHEGNVCQEKALFVKGTYFAARGRQELRACRSTAHVRIDWVAYFEHNMPFHEKGHYRITNITVSIANWSRTNVEHWGHYPIHVIARAAPWSPFSYESWIENVVQSYLQVSMLKLQIYDGNTGRSVIDNESFQMIT